MLLRDAMPYPPHAAFLLALPDQLVCDPLRHARAATPIYPLLLLSDTPR
jgi:hypothetical protein